MISLIIAENNKQKPVETNKKYLKKHVKIRTEKNIAYPLL